MIEGNAFYSIEDFTPPTTFDSGPSAVPMLTNVTPDELTLNALDFGTPGLGNRYLGEILLLAVGNPTLEDAMTVRGGVMRADMVMELIQPRDVAVPEPTFALGLLAAAAARFVSRANGTPACEMLQAAAEDAIDEIDRNLFERYGDVQAFAHNPRASGSATEIATLVDFLVGACGVYDLMLGVDLEERVLGANTSTHEGRPIDRAAVKALDLRKAPFLSAIRAGRVGRGESFVGAPARRAIIREITGSEAVSLVYAAPIGDDGGRVERVRVNFASRDRIVGAIMAATRTHLRAKGMERIQKQILDDHGFLVDDSAADAILSDFNSARVGLQAALEAVEGGAGYTAEIHKRRQIEQINGFAASTREFNGVDFGWSALIRQDAEEAYEALASLQFGTLVACLVAVSVIATLAWWTSGAIVRPVQPVSVVADVVAEGDLTVDLDAASEDEVGRLASTMRGTVARLNRVIGSVKHAVTEAGLDERSVARREPAAVRRRVPLRDFDGTDRVSDEPARLERSGRGSARGRRWQGGRGRRRRGPIAGRAQCDRSPRDDDVDRRRVRKGGAGPFARGRDGRGARRDRRIDRERVGARLRDRRREPRAGRGDRSGQRGSHAGRPGHPGQHPHRRSDRDRCGTAPAADGWRPGRALAFPHRGSLTSARTENRTESGAQEVT